LVGALIAITGFDPEHWFAKAFATLGLPDLLAQAKTIGIDPRFALVAVGIGIILADWLLIRRGRYGVAMSATAQAVAEGPALATEKHSSAPPPLSLIVLPFANLSDDREQEWFADAVTDDLTTELSRITGSFVIGRGTAFTFKDKQIDPKSICSELNVRYALIGGVSRSGSSVRINAQLVDGSNGSQIWADKFRTARGARHIAASTNTSLSACAGSLREDTRCKGAAIADSHSM